MKKLAFIALVLMLQSAGASAQSVGSVLEAFGLLRGAWAADCSKGPSTSNWYGRFRAMPNGEVKLTYSSKFESSGDNVYMVRSAWRLSAKELLMTQEFVREERSIEVLLRVEGDRYQTMSAKQPDGRYQVRDGKFESGAESPWLHRC